MSSQDYALDYDDANVLRRVTLDDNGNLRIYSFSPKNKSPQKLAAVLLAFTELIQTTNRRDVTTTYLWELVKTPQSRGNMAMKNITTVNQAEKQFKAEVSTIGRVHHVNLVRLLGYCAEGGCHLLVYEFMPNGSLDHHLSASSSFAASQEIFSTWETRHSIALGIAKGLTYLHEKCGERIIHCDIKPQNVLLDESSGQRCPTLGWRG
ncbi:hypothetical protein SELMODRAFT_432159 [Selaginella moellendorffii]|uniref:Protein kinase domain-containing protein n=1 Tax=Selaginella moellendorffii TaxID=88036 RepID=D8TF59_SELML|nr:hypothetical protein SELMODRAFT_432159 [Selaginella moellendorffii]